MSSENVKKIYVLNLDKKRIIILSGIFLVFFGFSFLAGLKWETEPSVKSGNLFSERESTDSLEKPIISMNSLSNDKNLLALPEEDNRIFSKNAQTDEDPFLIDPPSRSAKKIKDSGVMEKTAEKKTNIRKVEKKISADEKYYTIQLAAFPHEKDALAYKKDLQKKGLDARVDQGKLYYFVRVGKSAEKGELDTLYKKIHDTMKIQSVLVQRKIS